MSDQEALLKILQAQGQQFLDSFASPASKQKKRKRETDDSEQVSKPARRVAEVVSEDEWQGIAHASEESEESDGSEESGDEDGSKDFEQEDDGFTAGSTSRLPDIVVFADAWSKSAAPSFTDKLQKRAFMSSKVSRLSQTTTDDPVPDKKTQEDVDAELTNVQNDAILHRLVHTKLLSGSLNPDLNLTPAQRKKALAGRVLELASGAKIGKGEKAVRETETNKAAKRVREGLLDKKTEREKKELEEAKNLGNYHPTLKKVYEPSSSSAADQPRKRDRGLKMGVGKFRGGMLKLSRDEISTAQGGGARGRGGSRGRGGRGGGGRGGGGRGRGRGRS
ncbi:hypothetical protein FIBSPDRAFT_768340 [Athelia psychrophila]|uniref:Protein FAF1 n=1 Tax=Athelia psychrophila TaxID=1759441 RepID=A0A167UDW2_9AGAM|nr:hypothetical protein FIBSPDRAFT_768340 [Fibularhizoctonia sp. CBS 109695]